MKDSSSTFLVILVLLVTLIGAATGFYLKKRTKLELYDVPDLVYAHVVWSDEEILDFATSCHRIDLK